MVNTFFFFGLAFLGTCVFGLSLVLQSYGVKTVVVYRLQASLFAGLYLFTFLALLFSDVVISSPEGYVLPSVLLTALTTTALFFVFQLFFILGYSVWSPTVFGGERLYTYFMVFLASIGSIGSHDPLWLLLLLEIAGFAAIGQIGSQGSANARAVAFTYLIFSSLATLLYCFGMAYILPDYFSFLVHITEFDPFMAEIAGLMVGAAFLIKLGLGPFARYLVDGQTVATYPDFAFMSTVGKLPYLIAFYQLAPIVLGTNVRMALAVVVLLFAAYTAILMVSEQSIRRFFAYSGLFNTALGVLLVLFSAELADFFMIYMLYYIFLSLLIYLSFSFFGFPESQSFSYPAPEARTFEQLASTPSAPGAPFAFWLSLLFGSGLPPFGIFVVKALALGSLFDQSGGSTFSYSFVFGLLAISTINMVAYFRAMMAALTLMPRILNLVRPDKNSPIVLPRDFRDPLLLWGVAIFYFAMFALCGVYYILFWALGFYGM
jgi:formate hydrogenlyase subunit 3/multisubunit Na+/H+ antiporter MnhD subunit